MRRKEIEARLAAINTELTTRAEGLTDTEITALETEVRALQEERAGLDGVAERRKTLLENIATGEQTEAGVEPITVRNFLGTDGGVGVQREPEDRFDTMAYRTAFMNYVCRGAVMPTEYRTGEMTTTGDAGAVIPTTILNEIIIKLSTYGNIYAQVRKLNVQGGVAIPILSIKPQATWIGENKTSLDKKLTANDKIVFNYYGVECKIAQSLLASIVTLKMFQDLFVPLCVEAIVRAIEVAIMVGDGTTQPLGILKDSRVPAQNTITMTTEDFASWSEWKKKVFAKMKKAYRKGNFLMAQGTFDGYIDGMVDKQGQPIGRVNYGIEGEEKYRFGGKTVETVEDEIIANYEDAAEGDVIGVFVNLNDYAINSNMQMQTVKWTDNDTNEIKNKCILICDGKLVDPNGVLIIKKGADVPSA